MQCSHYGLDPLAQQVVREEWERLPHPSPPSAKHAGENGAAERKACPRELSPVIAVLPQLIRLAEECTDRPVNKLRPTIKRLILEQLFMEVGGDSIVDAYHVMQVKHYVELTIRVLVRIRHHDLGKNEWSDAPVTPQMFG